MSNLISSKDVAKLFNLDHAKVLQNIKVGMGDRLALHDGQDEIFLEPGTMAQLALWMNPSKTWLSYSEIVLSDATYLYWLLPSVALDLLAPSLPGQLKTKADCLGVVDNLDALRADPLFSQAYEDPAIRGVTWAIEKLAVLKYAEFVTAENASTD